MFRSKWGLHSKRERGWVSNIVCIDTTRQTGTKSINIDKELAVIFFGNSCEFSCYYKPRLNIELSPVNSQCKLWSHFLVFLPVARRIWLNSNKTCRRYRQKHFRNMILLRTIYISTMPFAMLTFFIKNGG